MNLAALTGYAPAPSALLWNVALADVLGCTVAACPDRYATYSPVANVTPDDSRRWSSTRSGTERALPPGPGDGRSPAHGRGAVLLLPIPGSSHAGYADQALLPSLAFLRTQLDLVARR